MLFNSSHFGPIYLWLNIAEFQFSEVFEWNNSFQRTRSGKDLVCRVRRSPRKFFKYTNSAKNSQFRNSVLSNLVHSPLVKQWGIANWGRLFKRTLTSGTDEIIVEGIYPVHGLLLIWKSFTDNTVVEYYNLWGTLQFQEPLSKDWEDALIAPIAIGRIYDPKYRSTGIYGSFQFELETDIHDNLYEDESDYSAIPKYNGVDLFYGHQHYSSSSGSLDIFDKSVDIFDHQVGRISAYSPLECSRHSRKIILYQETVQELAEFISWLHRRAGRLLPFYAPTWNSELDVAHSGLVEGFLDVVNDGYNSCDDILAIRDQNGVWYIREVLSASVESGALRLALSSNLNMDASEIERISFLKQYALTEDKVEIRHFGNFTSECELSIEERF